MKMRQFLLAVVLMTVVAVDAANAQSFPYINVQEKNNMGLIVRVNNVHASDAKIAIETSLGGKLYTAAVESNKEFIKSFDLKNLNNGVYSVEIENSQSIQRVPFRVRDNKIVVENELRVTSYKPQFRIKSKSVDVNILNLEHDFTSMLITDEKGRVVFKDQLGSDLEVQKRYDLSKLNNGVYHIVVNKGNRSFNHEIALN